MKRVISVLLLLTSLLPGVTHRPDKIALQDPKIHSCSIAESSGKAALFLIPGGDILPAPVKSEEIFSESDSKEECVHEKGIRWSMGFIYFPYTKAYSLTIENNLYALPSYLQTAILENDQFVSRMDFEIGLEPVKMPVKFTVSFSYISNIRSQRIEQYYRPSNPLSPASEEGKDQSSELQLTRLFVGAQYYIMKPTAGGSSIYCIVGLGKQFAGGTHSYKGLFLDSTDLVTTDNRDEFVKKINSPFFVRFGAGGEYFFNDNFSINGTVRFEYYRVSAVLNTSIVSSTLSQVINESISRGGWSTDVGLGVNFYF